MKKLLVLLLVICVIFAGAAGYLLGRGPLAASSPAVSTPPAEEPSPTESPSGDNAAEPDTNTEGSGEESLSSQALDYEALYALHAPEDVVLYVDGKDVTWDQYFYMLYSQASYIEDYFDVMSTYYGIEQSWLDPVEEDSPETFMDVALESAEDFLREEYTIRDFAETNGVVLSEEIRAELDEQLRQDILSIAGEDGAEEDFWAYMAEDYVSENVYHWLSETNYFYQQGYIQLYGETGELYDEAAAIAWLEDNGYLSASHILLMTVDPYTGEALDEAAIQEKYGQAESLLAELRAIEEPEALLRRFAELKEEYCEDGGKISYPDGYTFTPGTMVTEFEDAVNALGDYGLSDIVETTYGYHIILRLPLGADSLVFGSTPMTARSLASNEEYSARLQAYYDAVTVEYAEGFRPPVLTNYTKKA